MEKETKNGNSEIIPVLPLMAIPNSSAYINHIIGLDSSGMPIIGPYKVGEYAKDIAEHAKKLKDVSIALNDSSIPLYTRVAKFLNTDAYREDITGELRTKEGMLFLLGDGNFPIGCGRRDLCTVMAVKPRTNNVNYIIGKIYDDIGTNVKTRATGRLGVSNDSVWVKDFTTPWFGDFRDYADVIRALTNSDIASKGTPILFSPTFR